MKKKNIRNKLKKLKISTTENEFLKYGLRI